MRPATALVVALVVLASLGAFAQSRGQQRRVEGASVATVRVVALDSNGKALGVPEVSLFEDGPSKNLAAQFQSGFAQRVPFGVYRMKARVPGFYPEVRYVRVYQRETVVLIGLQPGYEASPVPEIVRGHVKGQAGSLLKNTFAKLNGVFSSVSMESVVAADGSFQFAGVPWGRYVLLILAGPDVIGSRFVRLPQDGPNIEIEAGKDRNEAQRGDVLRTPLEGRQDFRLPVRQEP